MRKQLPDLEEEAKSERERERERANGECESPDPARKLVTASRRRLFTLLHL